MAHVKWLHLPCHVCGEELNTWDMRISHALGYEHITCEKCVAKEYGLSVPETGSSRALRSCRPSLVLFFTHARADGEPQTASEFMERQGV